jgi:pimeloyl-ACP methyl ester carboxylesterase
MAFRRFFLTAAILLFSSMLLAAQDDEFVFYSELAQNWYQSGDYFEWTSTTADNDSESVNIFYRTWGDESKPKLLLVHGFPNSSFDYYKLIPFLEDDYHIAALDFPGSGFSDKPLDGFNYMLAENAEILDYFVREVVQFDDFALYTHDRGVSIGLAFLGNYLDHDNPSYTINTHFLSNSGMFLPLANLVPFQLALLDTEASERLITQRGAKTHRGRPRSVGLFRYFRVQKGQCLSTLRGALSTRATGKRGALVRKPSAQLHTRGLSLGTRGRGEPYPHCQSCLGYLLEYARGGKQLLGNSHGRALPAAGQSRGGCKSDRPGSQRRSSRRRVRERIHAALQRE